MSGEDWGLGFLSGVLVGMLGISMAVQTKDWGMSAFFSMLMMIGAWSIYLDHRKKEKRRKHEIRD